MTAMFFQLFGGVGLFILGMILLTDGLKSFAGQALKKALVRFTGTPFKAFGSGALVTTIVQSSSATTVTVIGFVSAGLLTFPQAVGVVLGASLGTTGTGWIVSVLGLKVSVGYYALPLAGVGAFLRLLGHGRWKHLGLALAGFGLIFVGIGALQEGMTDLSGLFNLAQLPAIGLFGHLLAMFIGVLMTMIMQSSSAAVATILTALHTGAVSFDQAASLVIGTAVGTTVTGALAAIGGSIPAKRTALAHVLFNLATGLIAVFFLPVLLWIVDLLQQNLGLAPGAVSLAAFHTFFIAMGVAVFLPFVKQFSRLIERLLPDKGPMLTRHLDDSLLHAPAIALEATRRVLTQAADLLLEGVRDGVLNRPSSVKLSMTRIREALDKTQEFFSRIPTESAEEPLSRSRVNQIHAMDHLSSLTRNFYPPEGARKALSQEGLQTAVKLARDILESGRKGILGRAQEGWQGEVREKAAQLAELRRQDRSQVLSQTAQGQWDPTIALEILDAVRWLDRICYHAWRICNYLGNNNSQVRNEDLPDPEDPAT